MKLISHTNKIQKQVVIQADLVAVLHEVPKSQAPPSHHAANPNM